MSSKQGRGVTHTIELYYLCTHTHTRAHTHQLIYRQSLDQSSVPEQIISCCVGSPEDLAVDWLGKNLYWTDSSHGTIEVAKLDGRGRYLLARNLNEPAMISLDPVRGYVCVCYVWEPNVVGEKVNFLPNVVPLVQYVYL